MGKNEKNTKNEKKNTKNEKKNTKNEKKIQKMKKSEISKTDTLDESDTSSEESESENAEEDSAPLTCSQEPKETPVTAHPNGDRIVPIEAPPEESNDHEARPPVQPKISLPEPKNHFTVPETSDTPPAALAPPTETSLAFD